MTKKELLDNQYFKRLPDDAEIVFERAKGIFCKMQLENIAFGYVVQNTKQLVSLPLDTKINMKSIKKYRMIIKAMPLGAAYDAPGMPF